MRFTDMADEMFGAAQGALPAGVRLATAKRGGVTITRVEIAREGLAKPRGRYVTLEMPSVSVLDERDAAVIETCAAELRALLPPEGPVLGLGISSFVMLSTESLLSISFSSSLARYGGDVAVGAMTVITSVSQLCTMPIQGICQGGQPVMSFNFGAGKKPRVKEAFRFQLTLCFGYTTLFWLLMMLVPGVVAGIFTSDAALIEYTTWAMRIYMAGILAMGVQIACQQSFMALGQAKVSLLLACLRKIILLIPLIFILPCFTADKCLGVFLAEPVSDILAATITAITFFSRFDKILDKGAGKV